MYIVVIGGGKVGAFLARDLLNAGHEVFVVEMDAKRAREAIESFGSIALRGDGSEPSILAASGVGRADIVIATTGSDEDNLATCQLAKHHFKVGRTISLINNPENEALFTLLGVDVTVRRTQMLLAAIEEEIPARAQVHVLPVRGDREAVEVEIPPASAVVGKALGAVHLPPQTTVVAVIGRDGQMKPLSDDTVIEVHDAVVALTSAEQGEALLEALTAEG
jgi:trk system potassium uptake protein TrkA